MKLAKFLGLIIGGILYPFFWMLEWFVLLFAVVFETIDNLLEKYDKWAN